MKRARSKGTPRIPDSYAEYEQLLEGRFCDTDGTEYSFKKVGEDEDEAVCFLVDPLKDVLNNANEIHLDGTFKIVPSVPKSRQLFTVLAVKNDYAFPVGFALMKTKTAAAYISVLNYFKGTCEGLNPRLIISDFESGIKSAVKEVFPEATHKGCWFHFTQAILRRVQRTGKFQLYNENGEVKRAAKMLMAIALLPEHLVEDGYSDVKEYCDEKNITPDMNEILTYFKTQWVENVGATSFSVYGQPRRTNNMQESFHHSLNAQIGKPHPNIWEFSDALCSVASEAVRDHMRLQLHGATPTLGRRRRWVLQDKNILKAQENVVLGRITTKEFLQQMTNHVSSVRPMQTVHDEIDIDLVPLADRLRVHTVPEVNEEVQEEDVEGEVRPVGGGRGRGNRGARGRGARGRGRRGRGRGNAGETRGRGRGGRRTRGRRAGLPEIEAVAQVEEVEEIVDDPIAPQLDEDPAVVLPYQNYRTVPTTVYGEHFMDLNQIQIQRLELLQSLDDIQEASVPSEDSLKCRLCLTNRPTRVCLPCGHVVLCRACCKEYVEREQFHQVLLPDGNLMETHIRLPLICPFCRALIGNLPRVVIPI